MRPRSAVRRGAPKPLPVAGNKVTLLHDGAQCFPAMLDAIAAAKNEILLEMYWFHSDRTGTVFADLLSDKAREGVRVQIIYDAVGSWEASESMFDRMRAAGCDVHQFHPIAPWRKRFRVGVVNRRDHRKILVVDGRVFFTGGVNLGDPWAPPSEGGEGWRDDMIRVEGPAALQARAVFLETWTALGRPVLPRGEWRPSDDEIPGCESRVRVLTNFHRGDRVAIRREYLERIAAARRYVYIANSYFVPDRVVRRHLADAAERGVDVRVLVPGEGDVQAVFYAGRSLYDRLLSSGIGLWEWQRAVLHSKSAVIDDHWCTVGTYNLDHRSWRFNLEVNVAIRDAAVGRAMKARFEQDLSASVPVDPRTRRFRPLSERLLESFFYLFRKLL